MRYLFLLGSLLFQALQAQIPDFSQLQAFKPRAIGPASMSGRVTSIAVVNSDNNIIYIGTASGGLWKSTNGGLGWDPIFDKMDVGSIGAVAVQQNNPSVVWAGTGEGNPRNSHNSGKGIYKSLDGGKTWVLMGLENTRTIHRILINPLNTNEIYAATMGSIWGPNSERGVYKSTDGGSNWTKCLFVNDLTGCGELVMDPGNPNKLIAAMYEYQRKPYTFTSGGKGSGLYTSIDGGKTWNKLTEKNGLPEGNLGRMGVAIAASNSNKIYATIESNQLELYGSNDGGEHWKKISSDQNMGNRPFYYSEIYVNPSNENHIISLWSQVTESIDGGKTWNVLLDWNTVHPDHHAFWISNSNPKFMINGNDGGLNISHDAGATWRYVANLPVGQFYHINVDDEIPYHVYGGLQDNGSWKGPGYTFTEGGIRNSDWKEMLFGDGFDVVPLKGDHNKGYAAWQGGNVYFYNMETGQSQAIQPVHPAGTYLRFNWNAGIAAHPTLPNALYYGSQYLHRSYNNGLSWQIISPDLSTNDSSKLHQAKSGGLTIDATNAENYCTIISIAPAKSDTNVIWVGTDDGNLQLTKDGGKTWTLLTPKITGAPKNAWIPFIQVSAKNPGTAWVVMNNYRQNDWQPYLFMTKDFGQTWTRKTMPNQVSGHCLSVLQDPIEPKLVWLGTDHGLYISFDEGGNWKKWTQGFPSCPTQDMVLQERENDLVIGTFGRGIYIFDDISAFRAMAAKTIANNELKIIGATNGTLANYSRPVGERFGAATLFEGANKAYGACISIYTAGNKNSKTGKWENSKFVVRIYKDDNLVRSFKVNYDSGGYNRFYWSLNRDGFRFPSHSTSKKDEFLPGGSPVLPGEYKLVISKDKLRDSTMLTVFSNPLIPVNEAAEKQREALNMRLKQTTTRAYNAFEALKEAEAFIKKASENQYVNDSAQSSIKKLSKPLTDSLIVLKALFMQASDVRYYDDVTQRLNEKLGAAASYIGSNSVPTGNAETAVQIAESYTEKVLKRVNSFFNNQWSAFVVEVEKETVKVTKIKGEF